MSNTLNWLSRVVSTWGHHYAERENDKRVRKRGRIEAVTCQFVHFDVLPVKLDAADAVAHVGLPANQVRTEVVHAHSVT